MYSVKVIENFNGLTTTQPKLIPVHQANDELQAEIKAYRKAKDKLDRETKLLAVMREKLEKSIVTFESVVDSDGIEMLTFKYTDEVERFDKDTLKKQYPDMYQKYIWFDKPQRRLVIKK